MNKVIFAGALSAFVMASQTAMAADAKGQVLVLLSSETQMALQGNAVYPTGYYLNEFGVPAKALVDAGYEIVLVTPKGNHPVADQRSLEPQYFDNSDQQMAKIASFVASLPDIDNPLSLDEVLANGLAEYEGLFIPGGHAPLIDLANNPKVGEVLRHFNANSKPTAAICHGPIALLSAQADPQAYLEKIKQGKSASANDWIYEGYRMTIFSDPEEAVFEQSLEGEKLLYYPADAMNKAGGEMAFAGEWQSNVVVDRELITGQNPFSDKALAEALIKMLDKQFAE